MAETNIPDGPFHSEPLRAIVTSPAESGRRAKTQALQAALEGVDLGEWDRTILEWLAGQDAPTVATVCSWLHRVREVGK